MLPRISTSAKKSSDSSFRKKKIVVTWFMAIIMVSSILGFIMVSQNNPENNLDYNKFKIISGKVGYVTSLEGKKALMTVNHPTSVETIEIESQVWNLFSKARVVGVTYNQSDERADSLAGAQFVLEQNLPGALNVFVQRGLLNASGTDLLNMSCQDAKDGFPVVLLKVGDGTRARLDGSCVLVEGIVGADVQRVVDRILFGLAGVMPRAG